MTTLYFGYGSNPWKSQMHLRCPQSQYLGIARLQNYRWIINERGYANVVELSPPTETPSTAHKHSSETWGLVYALQPSDEKKLDVNEGVPEAYTKEYLGVEFWPVKDDGSIPDPVNSEPESKVMLVYIDRLRVEPCEPKTEYVFRTDKGGYGCGEGWCACGLCRGSF